MSRLHTLFAIVLPSMLAGGVLFGSAFSRADDGRSRGGFWPQAQPTIVAQADPKQPKTPIPPVPPAPPHALPTPPAPPAPPTAPKHAGGGLSVSIHGGKVEIDGIKDMIDSHIQQALDMVRANKNIPADVRAKLEKRLEKVKETLQKRLAHLDINDLDQLGDELGKMGDEIGDQMDEFGKEMEKYGKTFDSKNFGKNWNFGHHAHDDDDDDDDDKLTSVPDIDDQDDLDDKVNDLGDLSLKGPQRDAIKKLRADSDKQVAAAKKALDQASTTLKKQLDNPASSDADIAKSIDAVTQQEAQIRKARILAWHNARRVLDDAQRKKVEDAAKKTK
jgi:hypothetical protein